MARSGSNVEEFPASRILQLPAHIPTMAEYVAFKIAF